MISLKKLFFLLLLTASLTLVQCGGPSHVEDFEIGGTESGNPPQCLSITEECVDEDEDGVCDEDEDLEEEGDSDDSEPIESDTGPGCLKVNFLYMQNQDHFLAQFESTEEFCEWGSKNKLLEEEQKYWDTWCVSLTF